MAGGNLVLRGNNLRNVYGRSILICSDFSRDVEEPLCEVGTGDAQGLGARVSVWMMISGKQNSRMGNREVPTPREVYPRMD